MNLREALTVTAHFHTLSHDCYLTGYAASIAALFLLGEQFDYTLLEVTRRLNQAGWHVADSTISPRLHELKKLGLLRDDGPKRPCLIRKTRKKSWRLTQHARELVTITQREDISYAGGVR